MASALAPEKVFHIARGEDFRRAQREGVYRPASLAQEGFIHCSTEEQVRPTLERYFRGVADLVLLTLDARRLGDALCYEPPIPPSSERVHERFPHLYAALSFDAVLSVEAIAAP